MIENKIELEWNTLFLIMHIHKTFYTSESSSKRIFLHRQTVENKLLLLFLHDTRMNLAQWRPGLNGIRIAKDNTGRKISLSKSHVPPRSNTVPCHAIYPTIYSAIREFTL